MVKPVVHSAKHMINHSLFNVAAAAIAQIVPLTAVAPTLENLATEVAEGAIVKAIFVELWCSSGSATAMGSGVITVEKLPGGKPVMTAANSADLSSYPNKNNIFYTTQGLYPPDNQVPLPLIRQWIKIPKGKQRMALGDRLVINVHNQVNATDACGISIYKEYS